MISDHREKWTRRGFLKRGGLAAGLAPLIVPASALGRGGALAPSERIRTGHIGVGTQGGGHLLGGAWTHVTGGYAGRGDAQVMAVCDIRRERREQARDRVNQAYAERFGQGNYHGCEAYRDFRELLAREDIDAVVIACPVHWHALMAIRAAEAGKDVYCEKPSAPTIRQGRAMADAVRRYARVYQAGTQQRSEWSSKFRFTCEMVCSGRIGELKEIYAWRPGGTYEWPGGRGQPQPAPDDLDWDLFLGPAQWLPYDGNVGTFRFQYGDINWTQHHYDFTQWVNGTDRTGPVEILYENDHPVFQFASGVRMHGAPYPGEAIGISGGACFVGTQGRIVVDRDGIAAHPSSLLANRPAPRETALYRSDSHAANFLECIRTRRKTICDEETAHRAASLVLLGGISCRLKRPLKWDPVAELFPDDEEANRWLSVATRPPWRS